MGLQELLCILPFLIVVHSFFVYEQRLPESVKTCFLNAKDKPVEAEHAEKACLMAYLTNISQPRDLTETDKAFFQRRIDSKFGFSTPRSGFRKRRDIRTLSDVERERLFAVISDMYWDGTLHRFGRLHGQTKKKVHRGAAFLPWHRVFILDFEEEMRKRDERVFLPYWDYTMDNNITKPSESVVWSDCFFGNGAGNIVSGPFKNWYGGHSIQLRRDIAREGQCPPRLVNKWDINNIMQKCHFEEITTGSGPYYENSLNLELLHDGVHDWVGGDMDELPFSAFDPVFYMHHAFIDYIWEKFRERQIQSCNVNPETDWRPSRDLCQVGREAMGSHNTMFGYTHLRNIDGSWKNWTKYFYNYEDQPKCPECGNSKYLYCDKTADPRYPEGICLTKTKEACTTDNPWHYNEIYVDNLLNPFSYPSISTPDLLKGLPGDGRHRDLSMEMSREILKAETARGNSDQNLKRSTEVDESLQLTFISIGQDDNPYMVTRNSGPIISLTHGILIYWFLLSFVSRLYLDRIST